MKKRIALPIAVVASALLYPLSAVAADDAAVISSTGTAKLVKQPDLLRLKIQLVAHADTVEATAAQFADLKTAAQAQLAALGADAPSIAFTPPALTDAKTDQQRQMERMVAQRMRGGGRKTESESPSKVAMSTTLTAEWVLSADSPEKRLIEIHELQKRVTDADLGGLKDREISAEDEELMEEMGSVGYYSMDDSGMTETGKPSFVVVGRISDQEHLDLLAESMAKARESAARLAKAAGASLGSLKSLSATSASMDPSDSSNYSRYYMYQMMAGATPDAMGATNEAVSVNPGAVTFNVMVTASFALGGA